MGSAAMPIELGLRSIISPTALKAAYEVRLWPDLAGDAPSSGQPWIDIRTGEHASEALLQRCLMALDRLLIRGSFHDGHETSFLADVSVRTAEDEWIHLRKVTNVNDTVRFDRHGRMVDDDGRC